MDKKGFTLVELLIAMVVGLVIVAAIYGMMNLGQQSSASVDRKVLTQQDVRAVLGLMAMEIRMVSFNPTMSTTFWGNAPQIIGGGTCAGLAFTNARKGIQFATNGANSESILVAMDLNGDSIIGFPSENEYITYTYDKVNNRINRRTDCGTNEAILGGVGTSTMVRNSDTGTRVFQYFDAAGTDISPLVTSTTTATADANIPLIRRIRITIVADVETQGRIQMSRRTYSTDVLVRNHVLSP